MPPSFAALETVPGNQLMTPVPAVALSPGDDVVTALRALRAADVPVALIEEEGRLSGILTRTDILGGLRAGPGTTVEAMMTRNPWVAQSGEPASIAAQTMQDHALKWLPVVERGTRRAVGLLHADAVAGWVIDQLSVGAAGTAVA